MRVVNELQFHPVGQGLFHSARVRIDDNPDPHLVYVYDCGTSSEQRFLTNSIASFTAGVPASRKLDLLVISHLHHDHISGLKRLLEIVASVDYVILPYFAPAARALVYALAQESMTANGADGLPGWYREFMEAPRRFLMEHGVENVIYLLGGDDEQEDISNQEPTTPLSPQQLRGITDRLHGLEPAYFDKPNAEEIRRSLSEERTLSAEAELTPVDFQSSRMAMATPVWQFLFYNRRVDPAALSEFYRVFADITARWSLLSVLRSRARLGAIAGAYRALAPSGNLNETALAMFSGLHVSADFSVVCHSEDRLWRNIFPYQPPPGCLRAGSVLTGDLTLKEPTVWEGMASRFRLLSRPRQTIPLGYLVPHHGSRRNWDEYQAELRACHYIASARADSKKHPHESVIRSIQRVMRDLHLATERTAQEMTFTFTFDPMPASPTCLEMETSVVASGVVSPTSRRLHPGRPSRPSGQSITAHKAFCRPLLQALVDMGGSGRTRQVLDLVGQQMQSILKPADYGQTKSGQLRWRNTAMWVRNQMANEDGRMKKDSPHGIWEISDLGREWLSSGAEQ